MREEYSDTKNIEIPKETLKKWQGIVNTMADIINVPAALIMRVEPPEITVLSASDTEENPYEVGNKENLLGLYCEEVIKTNRELLVADARESEKWKDNPDIELGMVSYFGFPLKWPDGDIFGTICVLDSEKNEYSELYKKIIVQFKELVETHLELIFQRREIEKEKEKTEKYLEAAGPLVVILNEEGKVEKINARGCSILGYRKEEIEGKNWFENFIPERIRKDVGDVFGRLMSGEIEMTENEESPVIVGGGGERIILWHNNIMKNNEGEIIGTICSGIDITERKEAQKKLKKSEEEKSLILNGSPLLIVYQNTEHEIIWANRAAGESVGKEPEDLVGKICYEIWNQSDTPCEGCPVEKAIQKGELVSGEIISPDGRVWFIKGNPVVNEEGNIIGAIETTMNITERKKAEEELRETKERYQKIVENADEWIWILDKEGNFKYANRAALEGSGYEFEKWLGRGFQPIVVEEDLPKVGKIFAETLGGKNQHYEVRIKDKEGNIRILQVNTAPLLEEGEAIGTVSVGRDVTEDKEKERELIRMDKLESIGVLAGGIAHDFNNLLMGIMGNISLAKMSVDDEIKEMLSDAEKTSRKASCLAEQLLTFSKGGEPIKEKISIEDVIRESAEFVLHGSNVKCEYKFYEDLWEIEADKGQMSQVINNIVLNADQSMPEGGNVLIEARNVVIGDDSTLPLSKGKYIEISIEDEGMGIPEEHLDKIFDPYFSTKLKGHGLGMATVYSIIQKHEGHVKVESKLGEGTTFFIYLPAEEGDDGEKDEKEEIFLLEKLKILLMDDEEIVRKAIGRMLKDKGSEVVFAEDGEEAVQIFKEAKNSSQPFDAMILDLTIPGGMGGKETVKKIREMDSNVKIIVASGYSNDPVMANYEKYGFNEIIVKPFDNEELVRVLKSVIGKV